MSSKNIFTPNNDINKTAILNWRTQKYDNIANSMALAEGFLASAIELSEKCLLDKNPNHKADMLIFPILSNANHGIELYLKALIETLNALLNSRFTTHGGHNIKQMFQTIQGKIIEYKNLDSLAYFNLRNQDLSEYIQELFSLITITEGKENMDFSRYPQTNKHKKNHFYIDSLTNVSIDLENFIVRFKKIKDGLDELASYYYYQELKNGE